MKRTHPQSLREVLEEAFREADMQDELLRQRAAALWPRIVGEAIAARCGKPRFISVDTMIVPVRGATLRQELTMARSSIAAAINDALKGNVVAEIRFVGVNANPQPANHHNP